MLDFYLIQDDQPNPDYPEQATLEFIGELDMKTFENLKKIGIIDKHNNFYADFRWNAAVVGQKFKKINQAILLSNTDIKKLAELLDKARLKNSGIIAYCD